MKIKALALLCGCMLGLASGAGAQVDGVLYDCDITNRDDEVDWISPKYAFVVQDRGVSVIDAIILHFDDAPHLTQPRVRGSELRLKWNVASTDSQNNRARMSYRAVLDTEKLEVTVRVTPVGYPQGWSGSGRCATRTP